MFEFTLTKNTVKRNQVTAIHLIAALIMVAMGLTIVVSPIFLNTGKPVEQHIQLGWIKTAGFLLLILGLGIGVATIFFSKKTLLPKTNAIIRIIEIICFGFILSYSLVQKFYLPAIYSSAALVAILVAYYLERATQKPAKIIINENGIQLSNRIKSSFWKWTQLERFVLKYNVVTFESTEKKLFQFIVEKYTYTAEEVISFCKQKIQDNIPHRIKDNW